MPKSRASNLIASSASEPNAKEKRGNAATNAAVIAAPAVNDDGGTPLLMLPGAAKTVAVKTGGWLWLWLLLLLLGAAVYGYSKWKKRQHAKYQNERDVFSEQDE